MIISREENPEMWGLVLDAIFGYGKAGILTARTNRFARTLAEFRECPQHVGAETMVMERPGVWDGEPDPGVAIRTRTIVDAIALANRRLTDGEDAVIVRMADSVYLYSAGPQRAFSRIALDASVDDPEITGHGTIPESMGMRFAFLT